MTDIPDLPGLEYPAFNDAEYATDTGRWSCLLRR